MLDLGALTVRLGHAADAGFGRAQLVVPQTLPLARALVLKTYSRARVGGALGPVRLDMVSVFDERGGVFPVFNAADSALTVGVALAILLELTGRQRDGSRLARGADAPVARTDP